MSTFHAYVDAAHFHEALGNVLRFAAKRSRLPILEEAQVRFEDGHCVLTCTNLDQWCTSTIPAIGDSFSFVFVGTRKILSACKYFSGELEFAYTVEPTETVPDPEGQISISDGKRSLKRSTERTSDFPELREKPLDRHYPVNPKRLLERFKRVKYAVSSNDARPNQCCIEFLKDKIIAVDGYRLAMSTDPAVNVENLFTFRRRSWRSLRCSRSRTARSPLERSGRRLKAKRCVCSPGYPAMTASMSKGRFPHRSVRNIPLMWISFWMKSGISTALSPQNPKADPV